PGLRRFAGTTDNVARLALDLGHVRPGAPLTVELNGQKLTGLAWPGEARRLWLTPGEDGLSVTGRPAPSPKRPERCGPCRDAFRHHMMVVFGTKGTPAENAWALAKARYDAETFWYRGNSSVEVVPDSSFDAAQDRDRSVILYGNADSNGAWA